MINRIIVLANKYPNEIQKNVNVFTQQLTWCFADLGIECVIICPLAINYNYKNYKLPYKKIEKTDKGNVVTIYRPKYVGFGQNNSLLQKLRVRFTTYNYLNAVNRVLDKLDVKKNDILFSEFLCPSGITAATLGKKYKISSYMQCGESMYQGDKKYGNNYLKRKLKPLTGVIAVSGHNKNYLVNSNVIEENKIIVLPSGYRKQRFYSIEKKKARNIMGFPNDKFIVGFCGSFDDRKGVLRLEAAIEAIEDKKIVLAAVGAGDKIPNSKKCIFKKPLNHEDLVYFYNSIDVFAFPTYHEGCCTAIVEAIACGCPIISSDRDFNYEICDHSNSILIDPDDIDGMKKSILLLYENTDYINKLRKGSLKKAADLSLETKAYKLIKYMEENMQSDIINL